MPHLGQEIRKVLDKKGMSVSEFARRINKSRENAYSIFARKSIDTELLEVISQVLDHDFFLSKTRYGMKNTALNTAEDPTPYLKIEKEILLIREELNIIRREIEKIRDHEIIRGSRKK